MNFKKILADKKYGFYVSLALSLLTLITGIVYLAVYGGGRDFRLSAAILMFVAFALSLGLLIKGTKYLPYVVGIFVFASFLMYVDGVYLYVSEVMVGIDEKSFSGAFLSSTIVYVITLVTAIVDIFLPQVKTKEVEKVEAKEEAVNE